jgi:hypothetical protein
MGRKSGSAKVKRRKKVTIQLIQEKYKGEVTEAYRILSEIRNKEHGHLAEAKIGLAYRLGWRADADGRLTLGQCRKRGDLDRELDGFDFIILLNKEAWDRLNEKQKRALIDHELCHAQIVIDSDGSPKTNDRDRLVTRIRKHDCEEFRDIVNRHGLWKQDLEAFANAAINDAKRPLFGEVDKAETKATTNGTDIAQFGTSDIVPPTDAPPLWRKIRIDKLAGKVTEKDRDKLSLADISTLGDLQDRMARHGTFWFQDIAGIGRAGADRVESAFNAMVMNFTRPAKAAAGK